MVLAADTQLNTRMTPESAHPVKGSTRIYRGAAVGSASGYARPLVAGDTCLGFALRGVDNTAGADADAFVFCESAVDATLTVTGASVASVGAAVYASADDAFTLTATGNSKIGHVLEHVAGTKCLVRVRLPLSGI